MSMFVLFTLYLLADYMVENAFKHKLVIAMAVIFIYFYLVSIVQGMLFKIIPFLSYTHLQQKFLMNFDAKYAWFLK